MSKQKTTAKQRQAKVEAAERKALAEQQHKERAERRKKIFTIVVCIILVLALGIPTVAISVMAGGA